MNPKTSTQSPSEEREVEPVQKYAATRKLLLAEKMARRVDALGDRARIIEPGAIFGRLVVLWKSPPKPGRRDRFWMCRCDCDNFTEVADSNLRSCNTESCGCFRHEVLLVLHKTHGCSAGGGRPSAEYTIWSGMRDRCRNPNNPAYKNYGGRGIKVCERWMGSFENFLEDMGQRPPWKHSIDRINNDGNYEPDNCRWATTTEQANNTTRSRVILHRGVSRNVKQWADSIGVRRNVIAWRIENGWDTDLAITELPNPYRALHKNGRKIQNYEHKTN